MDILKDRRYISIENKFDTELGAMLRKKVELKRSRDIQIRDLLKQYRFVPRFSQIKVNEEIYTYIGIDEGQIMCETTTEEEIQFYNCNIKDAQLLPYKDKIRAEYIINGVRPIRHCRSGLLFDCRQIEDLLDLSSYSIGTWMVSNGYVSKIVTRVNKKGVEYLHYLNCGDWRSNDYRLCATVKGLNLIVDNLDEIREEK